MMRTIMVLIAPLLACVLAACGAGDGPGPEVPGRGQALVITSDYQDGSWALIDMQELRAHTGFARISPDAVCRYDPVTRIPFIVSRMGADAVEVLDPEQGWNVVSEYSVGAGSNPQDIAVVATERAYVPRYAESDLLVIHPTQGTTLGTVDLGSYADADGIPEMAYSLVHDGEVFVALQRLTDFQPTDHSSLAVIDGASGGVERVVRLSATDPFAPLRWVPDLGHIAVSQAGLFGELDGGLELLAPDATGPAGLAITEEALGGDLVDAVVVDAHRGYAVIAVSRADNQMSTSLVRFDPSSGQRETVLLEAEGYDYSFLALTPDREQLWLTDRTRSAPGVRVFSVQDDSELTPKPIDTGLPPFMICFVPRT